MAGALPDGGAGVALELGACAPVLRIRQGGPQDHLHDERHRVAELQLRKVTKARGHFPSDEAALKLVYLGTQHGEEVDTATEVLESRPESVFDHVRRTTARVTGNGVYTEIRTGPGTGRRSSPAHQLIPPLNRETSAQSHTASEPVFNPSVSCDRELA